MNMVRRQQHALLMAAACSIVFGAVLPADAVVSVTAATRYETFASDRSPEITGSEVTIPFGMYYDGAFAFSVETAYSSARIDNGTNGNDDVSSLTDTAVSASYTYSWKERWGALAGIDVNLPTGTAQLSAQERLTEFGQNHDFFTVDDFGEGLNIGANLGVNRQFLSVNAALHAGYVFRGEYDATSDIEDDELDPGDEVMVIGMVEWQATPRFRLAPLASYTMYGQDKIHGKVSFRADPQMTLGANATYAFPEITGRCDLYYTYQGAGESDDDLMGKEHLMTSEGKNLFGAFSVTHTFSERWSLSGAGSVRRYQASDLKSSVNNLPTSGKRIRYEIGPDMVFRPGKHVIWTGAAKFFLIDADAYAVVPEDVRYTGLRIALSATYSF